MQEKKKYFGLLSRNQGGYVGALGVCKDLTDRMEVTRIPEDRGDPQSQGLSTWGPVHLRRDPPSLGGCGGGRGQGARISLHRASNPLPWRGHNRIFVDSHHSV